MDWMVQEQERGITITSAATTCFWRDHPHQHHRYAGPRRLHHRGRALAARARWRGRRVLLRRRRRAAIGDRLASGGQVPRAPRIAFINKMDRVGADFFRGVRMIRERLRANAVPIQLPIGSEENFRGIIDLITMKAILWDDDSLGARYRTEEIPAEMLPAAAEKYREELLEAVADSDEGVLGEVPRGRRDLGSRDPPGRPAATRWPSRSCPVSAAPRSRTRACSRCSMRSSTSCRPRPMSAGGPGPQSANRRARKRGRG